MNGRRESVLRKLAEIERRADDWLTDHVSQFSPLRWRTGEERFLRRKAFTELSLYLHLSRQLDARTIPAGHRLIANEATAEEFEQAFARRPRAVATFGYPAAYVSRYVDGGESLTETAIDVLERGDAWTHERPPYRMLERYHVNTLFGRDPEHDPDAILALSSLNHPPHPVRATTTDAYALTHDVFLVCDYGSGLSSFSSAPLPYDLDDRLQALLVRFVAEENYDLALELFVVGVLQGAIPGGLVEYVVDWVLDAMRERGWVPHDLDDSPVHADASMPSVEDVDFESDAQAAWARRYHAQIVAGITAKVVSHHLRERDRFVDGDREFEQSDVELLGETMQDLASYDLHSGAERLVEIADADTVRRHPDHVRTCIDYLRDQRSSPETIGYWLDERSLFERNGYDPKHFDRRHVEPTTTACENAIATLEDALDDHHER